MISCLRINEMKRAFVYYRSKVFKMFMKPIVLKLAAFKQF